MPETLSGVSANCPLAVFASTMQMYKMLSDAYTVLMNKLKLFALIGVIFVIITGCLSHFLYDWSGQNHILGLFVPINESVWEHLKLLFFPMLLYGLLMVSLFRAEYPSIIPSLCLGLLSGALFIPVFYYAYTSVLGRNIFILDMAAFILSIITAFLITYRLSSSLALKSFTLILAGLVCILFICFVIFTYHPPAAGIFDDPTSSGFPA